MTVADLIHKLSHVIDQDATVFIERDGYLFPLATHEVALVTAGRTSPGDVSRAEWATDDPQRVLAIA